MVSPDILPLAPRPGWAKCVDASPVRPRPSVGYSQEQCEFYLFDPATGKGPCRLVVAAGRRSPDWIERSGSVKQALDCGDMIPDS